MCGHICTASWISSIHLCIDDCLFLCQDFVKALEDESKKEQVNRTLRTVAGQSLQADPTPTYFNDPFMDNGGFFGVCKQGCTHGEAHEACVNAGAELASIHRLLFQRVDKKRLKDRIR